MSSAASSSSSSSSSRPAPSDTRKRVLLVDDHPIIRQGLAMLIDGSADLHVVGTAEDVPAGLEAVARLSPDVVVVDLSLKSSNGMDLIKQLREQRSAVPVLVLSMHDEALHAQRVLRAGAQGYIMKDQASQQVLTALRQVLAGGTYVSPAVQARAAATTPDGKAAGAATASPVERLTNRELEVFRLIGAGTGPRDIADRLGLSIKTVETHRENIKAKLGLRSAPELLRFAMQYVMDNP